jgi:hypothetical protein
MKNGFKDKHDDAVFKGEAQPLLKDGAAAGELFMFLQY